MVTNVDAEILKRLQGLRQFDSESVTAWLSEAALCFDIVGTHSGARCRTVKRRLRILTLRRVVMWKIVNGEKVWALNAGQFRGAPEIVGDTF